MQRTSSPSQRHSRRTPSYLSSYTQPSSPGTLSTSVASCGLSDGGQGVAARARRFRDCAAWASSPDRPVSPRASPRARLATRLGSSAWPASMTSASAPMRAASSLLFMSSHWVCLPCMRVRTRCQLPRSFLPCSRNSRWPFRKPRSGSIERLPACRCPRCRRGRRRTDPSGCRPRTWRRRWGDLRLRPPGACRRDRARDPWAPPSCAACLSTRAGSPSAAAARRASAPRR